MSCLVEVSIFDESQQNHVVRTALKGETISFQGKLPSQSTVVLIVKAQVVFKDDRFVMQATDETQVFPRPYIQLQDLKRVAEVCSGIGLAGFRVLLQCDHNERMLQLASCLHAASVHVGNVCADDLLPIICRPDMQLGTLAAGVACQPYSKLGDQLQQFDDRAQTLPGVLRIGFLGRFGAILLECVQEAHECPWVQQVVQRFANATGYYVCQGVHHLHLTWPARRSRWWCLLTHPSIGTIQWIPMPRVTPIPMVVSLLDHFHECTDKEMKQLELDLYELGRFAAVGFECNEVAWNSQMPTSLHSCGCQLSGCPCGCRNFPFTEARLAKGGLHGLLIRLQGSAKCGTNVYPRFRHIHPAELALLNGMLLNMPWGTNTKMALCALGQLASPIQSTWMGSLLMQKIQQIGGEDVIDPYINLSQWMQKLLTSRDEHFGAPKNPNAVLFKAMVEANTFTQPPPTQVFGTSGRSTPKPSMKPGLLPLSEQSIAASTLDDGTLVHSAEDNKEVLTNFAVEPMPVHAHDTEHALPEVIMPCATMPCPTGDKRNASEADAAPTCGGVVGFESMSHKKAKTHHAPEPLNENNKPNQHADKHCTEVHENTHDGIHEILADSNHEHDAREANQPPNKPEHVGLPCR